jgi:regulator of nucleoside diphosphate kinase
MRESSISITQDDKKRLSVLLSTITRENNPDRDDLRDLEYELMRAAIVDPQQTPADLITMNSRFRLTDLDSGEVFEYTLVYPHDAAYKENRISILAPLGTALLGFRVGNVVEWRMPAGVRRLQVGEILYQPEAVGDYHL